jgi:hypothetical protein
MAASSIAEPSFRSSQEFDADFARAISLREAGELQKSLCLLEAVMAYRVERHGRDHYESQCAISQYGRTLRAMGRLEEAQAVHWEVLLIRERVYGSANSYTTNSAGILEETLRMAKNENGAELLRLTREFALLNYSVSFRELRAIWPADAQLRPE